MLGSRKVLSVLLVLGLFAFVAPVVALADGGGSAGDQQYTDPLAGTKSPTTTSSHTTSTPAPSTPAPSAPAPASGTTPTPPASSDSPTTPTVTTPTATTAASPSTGTSTLSAAGARQLPYTGYDGRLAAAIGFVLVLGGIGLRFKLRRA